jgi:hypothetical protein
MSYNRIMCLLFLVALVYLVTLLFILLRLAYITLTYRIRIVLLTPVSLIVPKSRLRS